MKIISEKIFAKARDYESEDVIKSYHYLLISLMIWLSAYATILYSPYILIIAFAVLIAAGMTIRIFIMYHDYCHGAIFKKKKWLPHLVFEMFGVLIFFPAKQWTRSHDEHHANNSILNMGSQKILNSYLDGYFVVVDKCVWNDYCGIEKMLYRYRRSPLAIILGLFNFFIFPTIVKGFIKPSENFSSWLSLFIHVLIAGVCIINFGLSSLLCIYLSLFIATAAGSYIFYAQHNFPGAIYTEKEGWDYLSSSIHTTSFFKMGPILSWVTGNIGYHHLHHINSKIPFYRLPHANTDFGVDLKPHVTTWRLCDIKRNFKCNIWDSENEKFISYKEAL